jgi:hypothetical protein
MQIHKDFYVPLNHISATEILHLDAAEMLFPHNL